MSAYSTHAAHPSASIKTAPNWRWWIPAIGISRSVITSEIQRYLGADALVRPGQGKNENQGIDGYWISAYRNLTTAMIEDLKRETIRIQKEQQAAGGRYQDPPHHDPRNSGLGPTPPLPHSSSAYPPPTTGSPYAQDAAYPPPPTARAGQPQTSGYPTAQAYGTNVDPRYQEYQDYQAQQPQYAGQQSNVSPNASQYAHPHYTTGVPAPQQATAGAYPGYPSPPASQYPPHAYPNQTNIPRQNQYPTGAYTQAAQQGYVYPTASTASSNAYPGAYQQTGQYQNYHQ